MLLLDLFLVRNGYTKTNFWLTVIRPLMKLFKNTKISFVIIAISLISSLFVIYREQLLNGFSLISGDSYDYVISTSILEHWFNVFKGLSEWNQTNYYYPYPNTIAQTDAYFIVSLIYSLIRLFGIEPFLSAELSGAGLKILGFISIILFFSKFLRLPLGWVLVGSVLFIINNAMVSHSSRLQLATVAVAPLLTFFMCKAIAYLELENIKKFVLYGFLFGALFGAWCMTCFYMAWFWVYFYLVFTIVFFIVNYNKVIKSLSVIITSPKNLIAIFLVIFFCVICLMPFLYAFYPKSREVSLRTYEMVLSNAIPIYDVMQLGVNNYIFGEGYNKLILSLNSNYVIASEYYNRVSGLNG